MDRLERRRPRLRPSSRMLLSGGRSSAWPRRRSRRPAGQGGARAAKSTATRLTARSGRRARPRARPRHSCPVGQPGRPCHRARRGRRARLARRSCADLFARHGDRVAEIELVGDSAPAEASSSPSIPTAPAAPSKPSTASAAARSASRPCAASPRPPASSFAGASRGQRQSARHRRLARRRLDAAADADAAARTKTATAYSGDRRERPDGRAEVRQAGIGNSGGQKLNRHYREAEVPA